MPWVSEFHWPDRFPYNCQPCRHCSIFPRFPSKTGYNMAIRIFWPWQNRMFVLIFPHARSGLATLYSAQRTHRVSRTRRVFTFRIPNWLKYSFRVCPTGIRFFLFSNKTTHLIPRNPLFSPASPGMSSSSSIPNRKSTIGNHKSQTSPCSPLSVLCSLPILFVPISFL